ncbi:MAG: response regulator, partial [Burkholderiales bacterium]|nr:response regulator [Burkholderiales bacterium]
FSDGVMRDFPLAIRHTTGSIMDVLYHAAVYRDDKGKVLGVFASARDITERKQLDQLLQDKNAELERATAVAEAANLSKSAFVSSMSHELRTPLNAILGFAQLIDSDSPPPTLTQRRSLEQILSAGWYLLDLINEILDLAQIDSGKIMLSLEPVSLVEIMSDCQTMVGPQANNRGIAITFAPLESAYFIEADRTRAKQVLINLFSNAIKYNRPDGAVTVACALVAPDSIRISIQDTGFGMAPEQLAQLFQPFNRLGKESGPVEGTGIGLVVTKRLIELMGGAIGVDSAVGVGSVFWIEFKLTTAPRFNIPETGHKLLGRPQVTDGTPMRTLLYVEDNPASLKLIEQLLARRADLRMLSAADGNLGIEFARAHRPDIILMDINLPGINGLDAMKILRADPLTAHIPIIAVSANALPRDIEMCVEVGFFDYLTKPIMLGELERTIDLALKLSASNQTAAAAME